MSPQHDCGVVFRFGGLDAIGGKSYRRRRSEAIPIAHLSRHLAFGGRLRMALYAECEGSFRLCCRSFSGDALLGFRTFVERPQMLKSASLGRWRSRHSSVPCIGLAKRGTGAPHCTALHEVARWVGCRLGIIAIAAVFMFGGVFGQLIGSRAGDGRGAIWLLAETDPGW